MTIRAGVQVTLPWSRFSASPSILLSHRASLSISAARYKKIKTDSKKDESPAMYPHTKAKPPKDFSATKFRQWITYHDELPSSISVMSYNLLSQHYVWKQVFGSLDKRFLDWSHYRFPLINEVIRQLPCDIMCFQELECSVYKKDWQENFPLSNYDSVYAQKPNPAYWGSKPSEYMDGVGVFVNKDRFKLISHRGINFGKYVAANADRFDWTLDVESRLVPRNTVAVLLHLHDKITNENVFVANTHLYWLPLYNDVKVLQTKILLNALHRFIDSTRAKNPRIVMCGDFNSTPDSLVFRLLSQGKVDIAASPEFSKFEYGSQVDGESIADKIITNPLSLAPAYGPLLGEDTTNKLDFTSYTKRFPLVLDHIWCSSNDLKVEKLLGKVDSDYCERVAGFPDNYFPSDHIPLISKFSYCENS